MGQDISLRSERKSHDLNHDLTFSAHTINCVCQSIRSMFRVLWIYNFGEGVKKSPKLCLRNLWMVPFILAISSDNKSHEISPTSIISHIPFDIKNGIKNITTNIFIFVLFSTLYVLRLKLEKQFECVIYPCQLRIFKVFSD